MRVAVAINHRLNAVQIGNHQSGTCCLKDGKYKGRTVQGKIFPGTHRHRIQSTLCLNVTQRYTVLSLKSQDLLCFVL
jgi:hypothetical protein